MPRTYRSVIAAIFSKPTHLSKLRLSRALSPDQRLQLTLAMLEDVARALVRAGVGEVLLVTCDGALGKWGERLGLTYLHEEEPMGVNRAAELALTYAMRRGASATLLAPGDIPFVKPSDVREGIRLHMDAGLPVIYPSRSYDGTNLMIISTHTPFEFHYEEGAVWGNVRSAMERDGGVCLVYNPSIALDLDTEEDLTLARSVRSRTATSRYLASLELH